MAKQNLEALGLEPLHVSVGEAELKNQPTAKQKQQLNSRLLQLVFEKLGEKHRRSMDTL